MAAAAAAAPDGAIAGGERVQVPLDGGGVVLERLPLRREPFNEAQRHVRLAAQQLARAGNARNGLVRGLERGHVGARLGLVAQRRELAAQRGRSVSVLGPQTSVFYGAVLRGDIHEIRVGEGTNIQDNAIVHLADDYGAYIGKWCTIGHAAIIHACTIGDECLIGMGATVLDGAKIGAQSIVGANSLVSQRFECPPGSMVYGSPAKVIRPLKPEEIAGLRPWAEKYVATAKAHAVLQKGPA